MYQATFIKSIYTNHLSKQILWYILGFISIIFIRNIKLHVIFDYSFIYYIISNVMLFLVLIIGSDINGAKAWINLKIIAFQPSELMKISLLLYLIKLSCDFQNKEIKEFKFILKSLIVTAIPSILVFLEPDTGAIIIYLFILLSIFLLSGIKKRWFILAGILLSLLIFLFTYLYIFKQDFLIKIIGTSVFYRIDRLINFKNKSGLQLNNALTTIGNASFFGNGIKKDLLYVPEFPTDFAFTLGISIFGFCGGLLLILSYLFMDFYLIDKLFNTKNIRYRLFIHGFLFIFIFQQIQNIFMNIGLLPIMGIPLPFLSYGGSNMMVYFIMLGITLKIVDVAKNQKK
jgi:rod shape determining protein RodA